ncbi:MAG: hypothetical protein JW825_05320 [Candidatus Methanofastidiosa archaeon]|nr:hypothetical protein [Candidatus Methanofastidiosa archaeon]
MKDSFKTGIGFGLTSAIITTLGLMMGLYSGTGSEIAIIGGIITIAIADAFSDSLGIHISEESKEYTDSKHVWECTITTFLSKFIFALTFAVPVWFMELERAIIVNIAWGFSLITLFSYYISTIKNENPVRIIIEHVSIAFLVIIISYLVGLWVNSTFM